MILTLGRIWQSVLEEAVASPAELEQIHAEMRDFSDDPTTVMSVPGVIQPGDADGPSSTDRMAGPERAPVLGRTTRG
jgi:hypothetical protein